MQNNNPWAVVSEQPLAEASDPWAVVGEETTAPEAGVLDTAAAGFTSALRSMNEGLHRVPRALGRFYQAGENWMARGAEAAIEAVGGDPAEINRRLAPLGRAAQVVKRGADALVRPLDRIADQIAARQQHLNQTDPGHQMHARQSEEVEAAFQQLLQGEPGPFIRKLGDPHAWAAALGQAAPSLAASMASGGNLGVIAVLEGLEGLNDVAEFERRTGIQVSPEEFAQAQTQVMTIGALLEKAGVDRILGVKGNRLLSDLARAGMAEALTEMGQAVNANAAKRWSYDPTQAYTEGVGMGLMGGAAAGGSAGGLRSAALQYQRRRAEQDDPAASQEAGDDWAVVDQAPLQLEHTRETLYADAAGRVGTAEQQREFDETRRTRHGRMPVEIPADPAPIAALPAPGQVPLVGTPEGEVGSASELAARAAERERLGLTPDVRRAFGLRQREPVALVAEGEGTESQPLPEPLPVLEAQLALLADPQSQKDTVLVTPGSPLPEALPPGAERIDTNAGTFITTNGHKAALLRSVGQVDDDLAGYVLYGLRGGKPDDATHVLRSVNKAGLATNEIVVGPSNLAEARRQLKKLAGRGDRIEEVAIEQALAEREQPAAAPVSAVPLASPAERAAQFRALAEQAADPVVRQTLQQQAELAEAEQRPGPAPKLSPQERARQARIVDPAQDDLLTAIRKLGGLDTALESDWSGRLKHLSDRRPYLPGLERPGKGRSLDSLAETLHELHYLRAHDKRELEDLLWRAESGNAVYSLARSDEAMLSEAERRFGDQPPQLEPATQDDLERMQRGMPERDTADLPLPGRLFAEENYDPAWSASARTLSEIMREAAEVAGDDAVTELVETLARRDVSNSELAGALLTLIDNANQEAAHADRESGSARRSEARDGRPQEGGPAAAARAAAAEPGQAAEVADRREDLARRRRVDQMTPEEMRRELLIDELTGLGNRRAYNEAPRLPVQVSIDVDSLKWVNDEMGHESGDHMLRLVGQAIAEETGHGYHVSGDEFIVQAHTQTEADQVMARVAERLASAMLTVELPDGGRLTKQGVGFSYGTGRTLQDADAGLRRHKAEREREGLRGERGAEPAGVVREPAQRQPDREGGAAAEAVDPPASDAPTETPATAGVSRSGAFVATHELPNGEPVRAYVEDGEAQPGVWEDAEGNLIESEEAAPLSVAAPADRIEAAAHEAATSPHNDLPEPTQAQKEAGNYKVGKLRLHGLDISIENPIGSVRSGTDPDGKPWSITMTAHYGYIRGTEARDGDHIDVFLGPQAEDASLPVFVVDQVNPQSRRFDEHKVMLGYPDRKRAEAAYRAHYARGWKGLGGITQLSLDEFKRWLAEGDTTKRLAVQAPKVRKAAAKAAPAPAAADSIQDLGEKIGGARKDTAGSTGRRRKVSEKDSTPAWRKRYTALQNIKTGKWAIVDTRTNKWLRQGWAQMEFDTEAEAEAAIPLAAVAQKHRVVPARGDEGGFEIWRNVTDRKRVRVVKQTFPTRDDAMHYMAEHAAEIMEVKTGFGEEILAKPEKVVRQGPARRQGDVAGNDFMDTFGFRGVEFGNWNNQAERQEVMNHAYDGLLDLAELLDVPPRALSLNGELALAFGARGQGLSGARAHYESTYGVINLTKMAGSGALAHEWFHALDHYFGRQDGKAFAERVTNEQGHQVFKARGAERDFVSHGFRYDSKVREELREAYRNVIQTMFRKAEQYVEDTQQAEAFVGRARDDVRRKLDSIRRYLAEEVTYKKRHNKPASAEQLAEFDALAEQLVSGQALVTELRSNNPGARKGSRAAWSFRDSNDVLDGISAILKAVRGRSGFKSDRSGELDSVASALGRYRQRIEMLQQAREGEAKTKQVPTRYAMDAREIDQGRASDYWTTPHEMAARAFSAYVEDKLAEQGRSSDFLSFGSDNRFYQFYDIRPFPEGAERAAINRAFDALFQIVQTRETDQGVAMFRRSPAQQGMSQAEVRQVAERLMQGWKGRPPLHVVQSEAELPSAIREVIDREAAWGTVSAVYHQGAVYIVADRMRSAADVETMVLHEVVGHYGLRTLLGADLKPVLNQVWLLHGKNHPQVRSIIDRYFTSDEAFDPDNAAHRHLVAEELIAHMAETGQRPRLIDRVVGLVREWLRANGFGRLTGDFSRQDLALLLHRARQVVERGGLELAPDGLVAMAREAFSRAVRPTPAGDSGRGVSAADSADRSAHQPAAGVSDSMGAASGEGKAEGGANEPLFRRDGKGRVESAPQASRRIVGNLEAVLAKLPDDPKQWLKDKVADNRHQWLGALTLRHLADYGGDLLPQIKLYANTVQRMAGERNQLIQEAHDLAERWRKFAAGNRPAADALSDLMHDTTIEAVDPSKPYTPLITPEEAKQRIAVLRQKARDRSGEAYRFIAEIKEVRGKLAREAVRRAKHPALVKRYQALPPEAQLLYQEVRDAYERRWQQTYEALKARIERAILDDRKRRAALDMLRQRFESSRVEGPYFPLQRFGDYWVSAISADGEREFHLAETQAEQRELAEALRTEGYEVKLGRKLDQLQALDGVSSGFLQEIAGVLDEVGGPQAEKVMDDIWQLYLQTLPELSVRRQFIHRKRVKGFNADALRAYAHQMFHGAYQIARLRYADQLQETMRMMQEAAPAATDPNRAADLYNEMLKRHEWVMNPQNAGWVNKASALGFVWYLGVTPAAALVNTTQVPLVTLPMLATRFGYDKASAALTKAAEDYFRGGFNAQARLQGDEARMLEQLVAEGVVDKTLAHDLAGLSDTPNEVYRPLATKAMSAVSFLFHHAERFNREVTALAAYRLAKQRGMGHQRAVEYARDVVWDSHFDYSNTNRARFMQGDVAKVITMFRQFSLNMSYLLWRNFYQSMQGETPEVRREARRILAGVLGAHALGAGLYGMPLISLVFGVADLMHGLFGDDDEPWEAEVEFRNFLADLLGPDVARVVASGPANYLTGVDIASRVSLNNLWLRENDRNLEGKALVAYTAEQLLGPLGGIAFSVGIGYDLISQGHYQRGIEAMLPKIAKDGLRTLRFASEGAQTLSGDPLIDSLSAGELLGQSIGFTPARLRERYDANRAVTNYERHVMDRRRALMNGYALAHRHKDKEGMRRASESINRFNKANPEVMIRESDLTRSLYMRAKRSAMSEDGLYVNPKLSRLREAGRFAE